MRNVLVSILASEVRNEFKKMEIRARENMICKTQKLVGFFKRVKFVWITLFNS